MYNRVVVLNASYEPVSTTRLSRALVLIEKGVAEVEEVVEGAWIRSTSGTHPVPKVLRLIRYLKAATSYLYQKAHWSKKGVLIRDQGTCAYCGSHAATVDHVVPSSRGGTSSWLNTVASCKPCNNKKSDKTAEEYGTKVAPWEPTVYQLRTLGIRHDPSVNMTQKQLAHV